MELPKKPGTVKLEEKKPSRRQLMSYKARSMPGHKVTFRMDSEDPKSIKTGWIVSAKVGGVDPVSGLLGWDVVIRGKSGREVTIDSNVHYLQIHWDKPKAW